MRALFPFVGAPPGAAVEGAFAALREVASALAGLVDPAPLAAGADFSLGDCGWAPTFLLADRLAAALGAPPLRYDAVLLRWREAMDAVPAVQKVTGAYADAVEAWIRSKGR